MIPSCDIASAVSDDSKISIKAFKLVVSKHAATLSLKSQRGGELKCPPNVVGWSLSVDRSSCFNAAR